MASLKKGLYDRLAYQVEIEELQRLSANGQASLSEDISSETSRKYLIDELIDRIPILLDQLSAGDQTNSDRSKTELQFITQVLKTIRTTEQSEIDNPTIASPPVLLRSVHDAHVELPYPQTGLRKPWLFSSSRTEPSLLSELTSELKTTDSVDILVSFITWSGVRKIYDLLKNITSLNALGESKTKLRIITTTYMGATEAKAVKALAELPNVGLRISLDGRRTRLHAKAWIFKRENGFGTAYIGSANLSASALVNGIEWTLKVTERNNLEVYQNADAHFETLWNDTEFQLFDPYNPSHLEALERSLREQSGRDRNRYDTILNATPTWFELQPKAYQQEMLNSLAAEREMNRNRNLVVAATGTGKTVVAAFDYARLAKQQGGQPKLLFIAHRVQILLQAIETFRQVLRDSNFGELMDGNHQPQHYDHLFATITTINSKQLVTELGQQYWMMVIIDEAHHLPAPSFDRFATLIKPKILLGLTATPERSDGTSLARYFDARPDGSPAVSLRLWDALSQQLLCPFEYYATHDDVDFSSVNWRGASTDAALSNILSASDARATSALRALEDYTADLNATKAIGFCVSVQHVEFMTAFFNSRGVPTSALTGSNSPAEREQVIKALECGSIKVIFTCDLFNEGVDIPSVNVLLLLRPTQSSVLFQQQIGRGLRLYPEKESCLILDFIGTYSQEFRFDILFRSLTNQSRKALIDSVENSFGILPPGCHIQFDKVSKERVLENLKLTLRLNARRLRAELAAWASTKVETPITLREFLLDNQIELVDIYAGNHYWTEHKRSVGLPCLSEGALEEKWSKRLTTIFLVDDRSLLSEWHRFIVNGVGDTVRSQMLIYQIETVALMDSTEFLVLLNNNPAFKQELLEIIEWQLDQSNRTSVPISSTEPYPLSLFCRYTRQQILCAINHHNSEQRPAFREGCLPIEASKTEFMFITLDKTSGFAESVQYHDFAISPELFHWQTQNRASATNATGRRYLDSQKGNGWRFQIFVRENQDSGFFALGEVDMNSHKIQRPLQITWQLKHPMPVEIYRRFSIIRDR
jgi:superfamily II DNA or RNA helicase/HKD family nuclease